MANKKLISKILIYTFLLVMFLVFIFPFLLIIINSFKSNGEILASPFGMPHSFNFNHFVEVIAKMNFAVTFTNSIVITCVSTVLILIDRKSVV